MRYRHPPQRARDRVELKPRLVGEHCQRQRGARELRSRVAQHGPSMRLEAGVMRLAEEIGQRGDKRRNQHDRERCKGGNPRHARQQPACDQERYERRCHQAAANVIQYFPAAQSGERRATRAGAGAASSTTGHACANALRESPARDLPIAAHPAVTAADVGEIACRRLFVQLDVRQQPGTRVAAFDQVVAQDPVLGQPPIERLAECVDVVDSLADERAFAEKILVDIGHRARIRIDARLAA